MIEFMKQLTDLFEASFRMSGCQVVPGRIEVDETVVRADGRYVILLETFRAHFTPRVPVNGSLPG